MSIWSTPAPGADLLDDARRTTMARVCTIARDAIRLQGDPMVEFAVWSSVRVAAQNELMVLATRWNHDRVQRALGRVGAWRLTEDGSGIVNVEDGRAHRFGGAHGCDCEDCTGRLSVLRRYMGEVGCGTRLDCYHVAMGRLLRGETIVTVDPATGVRSKTRLRTIPERVEARIVWGREVAS